MILVKSIRAMVAYVQGQSIVDNENVLPGQSSEEKTGTSTITVESVGDAQEEPIDSGNYFHEIKVTLKSIGLQDVDEVSPEDQHNEKLEALETALKSSTLSDDLTAAIDDYHCFNATESGRSQGVDGDCLTNEFTFKLYGCPSTIAAA